MVSNKIPVKSNFIHSLASIYVYTYKNQQNLDLLEVFMVNHRVFRWPKHVFFHGFGGSWYVYTVHIGLK